MPLGAARLNTLSKVLATIVQSTRTSGSKPVTLTDDAHISTDQAKFGATSVELDGTNDAVDVPHADLNIGSGDFTIEFFYYPTDLSTVHGRYFFDTGSGVSGRLNGYFNSSNQFVIRNGNTELLKASHGMSTGQWYHLAISRASGTLRFYRDGTSLASVSNSTNFTNNDYRIGVYLGGGGFGLIGYIDEFRHSSAAKYSGSSFTVPTSAFVGDEDTELLLHFDGSNGDTSTTDDGPRASSEWSNGGWTVTSSGVFNNALQLSAGGSHAYLNMLPAGFEFDDDQTLTLEFRFKISDGGTSNKTTKIFSTQGINNDNYPTSSNHVTLHTYSDGNLYMTHDGGETNLGNPGTGFNHIAMTYVSGRFRFWLNGTYKGSRLHSINATTNLFFGNRRAGEGTNSGTNTIDEIRLSSISRYDDTLPTADNFTVPTAEFTNDDGTIALFHCESTSQTDDNS